MLHNTWTHTAVASEAHPWSEQAWRVVEAQHIASTMKLVDTAAEQLLLEQLLDQSKPPAPASTEGLHYLLATPFRYDPLRGGSRFRSTGEPGVFYGAQTVRTACAELGYWRWRFLSEAVNLSRLEPTAHTVFYAGLNASCVDLRKPPFSTDRKAWTHPHNYEATQALAHEVRNTNIAIIVYESVRDPEHAWCVAVLTPKAFSHHSVDTTQMQTWFLSVRHEGVVWQREGEHLSFSY